jgi:hypothetical protein
MHGNDESSIQLKRNRNFALLALSLIQIMVGVFDVIFYGNENSTYTLTIITSLASIIAIYYWCFFDSQLHNFRISSRLRVVIIYTIGDYWNSYLFLENENWESIFIKYWWVMAFFMIFSPILHWMVYNLFNFKFIGLLFLLK